MNCVKVQKKISAFTDGELDAASHEDVKSHLEACLECRKSQVLMEEVDEFVKQSEEIEVSTSFYETLLVRLEQELARSQEKSFLGRTVQSGLDFFDRFFDVLQQRKYHYTRSLEEFSDFPPHSLAYVYCRKLGQCRGGV